MSVLESLAAGVATGVGMTLGYWCLTSLRDFVAGIWPHRAENAYDVVADLVQLHDDLVNTGVPASASSETVKLAKAWLRENGPL